MLAGIKFSKHVPIIYPVGFNPQPEGRYSMDFYGIAATSMSLSQMKVSQAVDYAMMRKVMDMQQQSAAQIMELAQAKDASAAAPPSEHLLDVLV
jgi:hypothetical protein